MSPLMILIQRACDHPAEATFTAPRLALDRRTRGRSERKEVEFLHDFVPILSRHGGNRYAVRCAVEAECPEWLRYLDFALALPGWFVERSEPTPDLLALWNRGDARLWQLPSAAPARSNVSDWLLRFERAA